jgi:hypothetical protein
MVPKMLDEKWHSVALRLIGDLLPAQEVGDRLQLPTKFLGMKGQHISDNPRYAKHETNFWHWEYTTDTTVPFEQQLAGLLQILERRQAALAELLSIQGVEGEVRLGFGSENGQGGAYFPPEQLSRIAALGLAVDLHLYPPQGDGDEHEGAAA